ncbi:MAG: hypothetical protein KDB21_11630 [Acidimicrobiales bacterium]|nr:hypothetical protein [Acidimicrobiales bacterium]
MDESIPNRGSTFPIANMLVVDEAPQRGTGPAATHGQAAEGAVRVEALLARNGLGCERPTICSMEVLGVVRAVVLGVGGWLSAVCCERLAGPGGGVADGD